ncbi:MAG: LuxR C-terminal-related transcriptional regulator [Acidimicrobiales bacterium]|jgi:DNA-binding CsgD family transcriptional regulator
MFTTELDHDDMVALLEVISELAPVRPLVELRHDTVSLLPRLVQADHPAWNEVDLEANNMLASLPPSMEREWNSRIEDMSQTFMSHIDDHPVITHYRKTGDGRPWAISDFVSAEDFHSTSLYREFYSFLGTEDQISFVLPANDLTVGITADRAVRGFTGRDRTVLNLLRPHLVQAYRNSKAYERVQRALLAMEMVTDVAGEGVILLSESGRIEHATSFATRMLQRHFPGRGGSVPGEIQAWLAEPRPAPAPEWPFVHGVLLIRRLDTASGTVLLVSERDDQPARPALRKLGLTARECDVMQLIVTGVATKDVARRLEISPRTVSKHIERALSKLGVDSRTAATNLVNQLIHSRAN